MKKRFEIRLNDVEAQMLLLLQKKSSRFKDIERYLKDTIRQEYSNLKDK
jgi:hypothetical protein